MTTPRYGDTFPAFALMNHTVSSQSTPAGSPSAVASPPPSNAAKANTNTFVHKLFNMVVDDQYQHLIAWSYTGSSFIVCNIMDFSKDVLPKHFKHNNFSSFVRQLNMYGFHKVNKSPRGHRTLAENQIWEFSHSKFLRDRPDLLDDIKRKTMEAEQAKNHGDLQAHLSMVQMSQSDMMQQIHRLFDNFSQVIKELDETKKRHDAQTNLVKQLMEYIVQQNGGQMPHDLGRYAQHMFHGKEPAHDNTTPSIFVTSHESPGTSTLTPPSLSLPSQPMHGYASSSTSTLPTAPLTVRTQNLAPSSHYYTHSLSPLSATFPTSLASSPTALLHSDDDASMYSPRTPTEITNQQSHHHNQHHHHQHQHRQPTVDDLLHGSPK
ncbi:HSF-type DNA-binding-domain-containing protein [Gongronella butleri]|nr:HSF-type DNA-binding-domain-containing protein [Gongronella butleri]